MTEELTLDDVFGSLVLADGVTPEDSPSSWSPVDVAAILDGSAAVERATLLRRSDGAGLLYPGRVHWLQGETESGKSWVVQAAVVEALAGGHRVLYLDHESDARSVVGRLLALGADRQFVAERFVYVSPDVSTEQDAAGFAALLADPYGLAVIDGVNEALGLAGADTNSTDDVTAWCRAVPRRLARETGAAVVAVDHVTKSNDGRGRFPIGSQAKLSTIDGAAYLVDIRAPLGAGMRGELALRVTKDRPGSVRPLGADYRRGDRTAHVATFVHDARATSICATVEPAAAERQSEERAAFRPTYLMERASRYLEATASEAVKLSTIRKEVTGRAEWIATALELLSAEGYTERTEHARRGAAASVTFRSLKPYREVNDPRGSSGVPVPRLSAGGTEGTRSADAAPRANGNAPGTPREQGERVSSEVGLGRVPVSSEHVLDKNGAPTKGPCDVCGHELAVSWGDPYDTRRCHEHNPLLASGET